MKTTILILAITLGSLSLHADGLRGRVVDGAGEPMPYATVFIGHLNQATTTDLRGEFCFDRLLPGTHRLTVSFIGYKTVVREVAAEEMQHPIEIRMEEETVTLAELVVLPEGISMEEYILRQTSRHAIPLRKRVERFEAQVSFRLEKDLDLSRMPKRRTLRAAAWLMGYAKIMDALVENKYLRLAMTEELRFAKGKITGTDPQITEMIPTLPPKQAAAFVKRDKLLQANVYDSLYEQVKKKADEMQKAKKKGDETDMAYTGSYTFEGRTVYVVTYGKTELHVVDECWQILRIQYRSGEAQMYYEFRELFPGVFLPVSGFAEFPISSPSIPQGSVVLSSAYRYR